MTRKSMTGMPSRNDYTSRRWKVFFEGGIIRNEIRPKEKKGSQNRKLSDAGAGIPIRNSIIKRNDRW